MEAVTTSSQTQNTQSSSEVTPAIAQTQKFETKAAGDDFEQLLKALLPATQENNVSEEELFAALTRERLLSLKGEDALKEFDTVFAAKKANFTKPDGFVAYEAAAVETLRQLTSAGVISSSEGDQIYSEAFAAAQLDSNTATLWDRRGGQNDPTMAVEKMEAALAAARLKISNFAEGKDTVSYLGLANADGGQRYNSAASSAVASNLSTSSTGSLPTGTIKPRGSYVDGANGFLFKPISSNEGRLAVLLPESMAHLVEEVVLKDKSGKVIDRGRSTGYGDTGVREKFSFSRKGGSYPKRLSVEVRLQDGSTVTYKIPDPSKRYD